MNPFVLPKPPLKVYKPSFKLSDSVVRELTRLRKADENLYNEFNSALRETEDSADDYCEDISRLVVRQRALLRNPEEQKRHDETVELNKARSACKAELLERTRPALEDAILSHSRCCLKCHEFYGDRTTPIISGLVGENMRKCTRKCWKSAALHTRNVGRYFASCISFDNNHTCGCVDGGHYIESADISEKLQKIV